MVLALNTNHFLQEYFSHLYHISDPGLLKKFLKGALICGAKVFGFLFFSIAILLYAYLHYINFCYLSSQLAEFTPPSLLEVVQESLEGKADPAELLEDEEDELRTSRPRCPGFPSVIAGGQGGTTNAHDVHKGGFNGWDAPINLATLVIGFQTVCSPQECFEGEVLQHHPQ